MIEYEDIKIDRAKRKIVITFYTSRNYFHITCTSGKIRELPSEPPIHTFPQREQYEIEWMAKIAYAMIFGPEDLSE